jgi:hypothetical protein
MWKAMDAFGRKEAAWLPYWENSAKVRSSQPGVKVSIYNRPGKGLIGVIANMGREKCETEVAFDLTVLQQPANLAAYDILAENEMPFTNGTLCTVLESLDFVMVRLGANAVK